ncbi:MAG: Ig-like domain-containing protein [Deltaproteobacteria bacterium]|nr:Ig-like domain-containing protein [Deltaproteobacteria bacterium]
MTLLPFSHARAQIARIFAVALLLLVACEGADNQSTEGAVLRLATTVTPPDVLCLQVTVSGGTRQIVRTLPTTPGSTLEARLEGLPTGTASVSLRAFPTACAGLTPATEATWLSDVLSVTLVRGQPVDLAVTMRANGRINLNVSYDFDVAPDAGTPAPRLALCEHVSNRIGQRYYCVNEIPGATYSWISVLDGVVTPLASSTRCSPQSIILAGSTLEVVATVGGSSSAPLSIPFATLPPMPLDPLCTGDVDAGAPPTTSLELIGAQATSPTTVVLTFSRPIDPASVAPNGSQFVFNNGLIASAAMVSDRTVSIATSVQTRGTQYEITVANSITDLTGTAVGTPASALFDSFFVTAVVRINEINANISLNCDLIELRVIRGGSMEGFRLTERTGGASDLNLTFGPLVVRTNDFVVVHTSARNLTCNPGGATQEATSPNQQAATTFGGNFDAAYDWWSEDNGLTSTDNVFTLFDDRGAVVDAVFLSNDPAAATAASGTETAAAAVGVAGQWSPALMSYVDSVFRINAADDLDATGINAAGNSCQRVNDDDTNSKADWTTGMGAASTWGALNAGQRAL